MHTHNIMTGSQKVTGALADGNAVTVQAAGFPLPATVWVEPAAGDTITISYSNDGGVNYHTLAAPTTYYSNTILSGITNLKFQRTAGSGTTSTYGVC